MATGLAWSAGSLERQPLLWSCALVLYGIGDTVTTVLGLRAEDVSEAGPVALLALEWAGLPGYLLLKTAVIAGFYLLWTRLRTPGRDAVPLALVVTGAGVTLWNLAMLLS